MSTIQAPAKLEIVNKTPAPEVHKDLYDLDTVASRLSMARSLVDRLITGKVKGTPKLKAVQIGRYRYVSKNAIERWIQELEALAS